MRKILYRIEIFQTIISALEKSEIEILVVSAWFTNEEMFNILLQKQKQGVKVKLIIEEYLTSEKINFADLSKAGADVYKIEKDGLGMINKKYCIIDEKIAILTLFNWSANLPTNSKESIFITDNLQTIQSLKSGFNNLTETAIKIGNKNIGVSFFDGLKNSFFNFLGIKKKHSGIVNEIGLENNEVQGKAQDMITIKTNRNIDDELNNLFQNRN